ncbi:spliceosome-associated protein CWC27 homolog [Gadus morhua]|uniref:Spliceosome-associated protein CWC27 homolog n=1 Tax=Gadus morhua TaxID=8049 RepID=A0A8C5F9T6_GADMO|nr:spliceosome-associated protein CWC27 homolog [Gadus morhua]XP_030198303.1 spliceosome-associated protein CWC27 homolog [Gadus morhua]XP_059894584.1 spliceosome-associated protein CWC27 homolog [Gadus macrocephalus]
MSNIYIQEPPTNGKVLLKTSAGDIDIELWSKEAPKACRNFVQLCMEGYYDNTGFHRVVQEFIVQGGDPTGTGSGGESIYGRPFKDEFHSRLRFIRRGLVAMANAGPHDNGSQFFFTLARADELNNKHTIFGKVTGDTVYNMIRLAEVECDSDERPLNPHKIKTAEVLHSPFDDIIPRESKKKNKDKEEGKKSQSKATKNFSLLSFGEEAEEEEEMVTQVSQTLKGKGKSSHDLLKDDPSLSSVPAVDKRKKKTNTEDGASDDDDGAIEDFEGGEEYDSEQRQKMRAVIAQKLKKLEDANKSAREGDHEKKTSRSDELRKESRQLKKDLLAIKQRKEDSLKEAEKEQEKEDEGKPSNEAVAEFLEGRKKYEELKKQKRKKGSGREERTLALLESFKTKLTSAITETPEQPEEEELAEDDDKGWMAHVLQFDEQTRKVKDAAVPDEDTFEIYDPRNPVNKRRREESKKLLKEKKAKRMQLT